MMHALVSCSICETFVLSQMFHHDSQRPSDHHHFWTNLFSLSSVLIKEEKIHPKFPSRISRHERYPVRCACTWLPPSEVIDWFAHFSHPTECVYNVLNTLSLFCFVVSYRLVLISNATAPRPPPLPPAHADHQLQRQNHVTWESTYVQSASFR